MAENTHLREYDEDTRSEVRETYRKNHTRQTLTLAREKATSFGKLDRARMRPQIARRHATRDDEHEIQEHDQRTGVHHLTRPRQKPVSA